MPKTMLRRAATGLAASLLAFGGSLATARAAHDQLTIGIAQFPSSFNWYIDAETIKDYVLELRHAAGDGLRQGLEELLPAVRRAADHARTGSPRSRIAPTARRAWR